MTTPTSISTDLTKSASQNSSIVNLYHIKIVKLTKANYVIWRTHVSAILKGCKLYGVINGSNVVSSTIPNASEELAINNQALNHEDWVQQDNLLMGWLMTFITEGVLPKACACTSAEGLWLTLEKVLASNSQVRTLQLHLTLQTTKKGDKSMEEYISQMMHIWNALSLAGD